VITIVDLQHRHIRGMHEVIDSVSREKKYLAWTEAPAFAAFRSFVTNGLVTRSPQVVALENGKVIGWCDITVQSRPTAKHCGVLGMGILPPFRRQGIGTKLVHAALGRAKTYGLFRVELEVFEDNAPAIGLYRKIGFRLEGKKVAAVRIDNRYRDVLVMGLLLRDYHEESAGENGLGQVETAKDQGGGHWIIKRPLA
jgi:RimJ/RimL family protein N-acetyltransferase